MMPAYCNYRESEGTPVVAVILGVLGGIMVIIIITAIVIFFIAVIM